MNRWPPRDFFSSVALLLLPSIKKTPSYIRTPIIRRNTTHKLQLLQICHDCTSAKDESSTLKDVIEVMIAKLTNYRAINRRPPTAISNTQACGQALAEMCTCTCSNPGSPSCTCSHNHFACFHSCWNSNYSYPNGRGWLFFKAVRDELHII